MSAETVGNKILSAYESMAGRYNELIDTKPHNAFYDRPNTLDLIGEVAGKSILDAACGPGKYAEILLSKGASVTGFDVSPTMISLAQQRNQNAGVFFVHDLALPFSMLESESFDIAVCALAMHYLADWTLTIQEFCRVLKRGASLVISIEHPFFEYNFFKSKNYFQTEHVKCVWTGFGMQTEMHSYRRSLQECLQPLTENGFYIDKLVEPRPSAEFEKADPRHFKELNEFPAFMCIRAIKRGAS